MRQPRLLHERRHPVEHLPLLVQRGEVQHQDPRIVGEAEHRQRRSAHAGGSRSSVAVSIWNAPARRRLAADAVAEPAAGGDAGCWPQQPERQPPCPPAQCQPAPRHGNAPRRTLAPRGWQDADRIVGAGSDGLMLRPPARRRSGAEVDHLHAAIAWLRRLRRGRHQQAVLAHADRLQAARIDAVFLRDVVHHCLGAALGQGPVVVAASRPYRYGPRCGTGRPPGPCWPARWPSCVQRVDRIRRQVGRAVGEVAPSGSPPARSLPAAAAAGTATGLLEATRGCCARRRAPAAARRIVGRRGQPDPAGSAQHQIAAGLQRVDDLVGRRVALSRTPAGCQTPAERR